MKKPVLLIVTLLLCGCVAPRVAIKDINIGLALCAPHGGLDYILTNRTVICDDKARFILAQHKEQK